MDNNALFVFECLLRDNVFMCAIDEYIVNTIFVTKTFDAKNVPQMVLIMMTLLTKSNLHINIEKHIVDRIKENPNLIDFNIIEFKKSYEICSRLAVLKLKFSNKSGFCCVGK
jgi:hypothetical protein